MFRSQEAPDTILHPDDPALENGADLMGMGPSRHGHLNWASELPRTQEHQHISDGVLG